MASFVHLTVDAHFLCRIAQEQSLGAPSSGHALGRDVCDTREQHLPPPSTVITVTGGRVVFDELSVRTFESRLTVQLPPPRTQSQPGNALADLAAMAGTFLYNVTLQDTSGTTHLWQPLFVRVRVPSADVQPRRIVRSLAPTAATVRMPLQVSAPTGDAAYWEMYVPTAVACWLSIIQVGRISTQPPPSLLANALTSNTNETWQLAAWSARGSENAQVLVEVDVSRLSPGFYTTRVMLLSSSLAPAPVFVSLELLLSALLPCPRQVQLPPVRPPEDGSSMVQLPPLALQNVGATPIRLLLASVQSLPSSTSTGSWEDRSTAAAVCDGGVHSARVTIESFHASRVANRSSAAWVIPDMSSPEQMVVSPLTSGELPIAANISRGTTPSPGRYSAVVSLLAQDTVTGQLTVLDIEVRVQVLPGTVHSVRSWHATTDVQGGSLPLLTSLGQSAPSLLAH